MSVEALAPNGFQAQTERQAAWLAQPVGVFLQGINWEDKPPVVQALAQEQNPPTGPLSLRLSVSQFFAAIPWLGQPTDVRVAAAAPSSIPVAATEEDFTLDQFSDLF